MKIIEPSLHVSDAVSLVQPVSHAITAYMWHSETVPASVHCVTSRICAVPSGLRWATALLTTGSVAVRHELDPVGWRRTGRTAHSAFAADAKRGNVGTTNPVLQLEVAT